MASAEMSPGAVSLGSVVRVVVSADALGRGEIWSPPCLAGEDNAGAVGASDADGTSDLGAILSLARRRAASTRVERGLGVEALV